MYLFRKIMSKREYVYAPIITALLFMLVLYLAGAQPFGTETLGKHDYGHTQFYVSHHTYDWLHGQKDMFFDWHSGLSTIVMDGVSPFHLFYYMIPRSLILGSLPYYIMVHLMAASVTMYLFLKKAFRASVFWTTLFGVSYALSGYTIQYFSAPQWLSAVVFFPMVMLGLLNIIQRRSVKQYIIWLTLCLCSGYYCSAFVLLFIFLISGLYLIFISRDQKKNLFLLGMGTSIAVGLSAWVNLPLIQSIAGSSRMDYNQAETLFIKYLSMLREPNSFTLEKTLLLFPLALGLALIVIGIVNKKNDLRVKAFVICAVLMMLIPYYLESVSLVWHFGSYMSFPVRFGFISIFVLLAAACYYVSKVKHLNQKLVFGSDASTLVKQIGKIAAQTIAVVAVSTFAVHFVKGAVEKNGDQLSKKLVLGIYATLFAVYFLILFFKKFRLLNYRFVFLLLAFEISWYGHSQVLGSWGRDYFINAVDTAYIKENIDVGKDDLSRIKVNGHSLASNYPLVLERPSISSYLYSTTWQKQVSLYHMGYSTVSIWTLDTGGTVFSDAMLNVEDTLSAVPMDDSLYAKIESSGRYTYYKNRYTFPFGITANSSLLDLSAEGGPFQYQNNIYKILSGSDENLINDNILGTTLLSNIREEVTENEIIIYMDVDIQDQQALYFSPLDWMIESPSANSANFSVNSDFISIRQFSVNGDVIHLPSLYSYTDIHYPQLFNNNLVCLGAYDNETVTLEIRSLSHYDELFSFMRLGLLDLSRLHELQQDLWIDEPAYETTKNSLSISVQGTEEKDTLFLPISYDDGWVCAVNGEKADIHRTLGTLMGIKLNPGENNVKLKFTPPGLVLGVCISFVAVILCFAFHFFRKHKIMQLLDNRFVSNALFAFYSALWGILILIMYIIPFFYPVFRE